MKFPSFKKCPKGHRKEYYHPTLGSQWCLWCPKCNAIFDGQNFYEWSLLAKIDNFYEEKLSPFSWKVRFLSLKDKIIHHFIPTVVIKCSKCGQYVFTNEWGYP